MVATAAVDKPGTRAVRISHCVSLWAGRKFEDRDVFRRLAYASFRKSDRDGDGIMDVKELHIALLLLYDKLNSVVPVHMPVPDKAMVGAPPTSGTCSWLVQKELGF